MNEFIRVLAVTADGKYQLDEYYLENTLSRMQEFVGGYIETVSYNEVGVVLICDEDGLLKDKNATLLPKDIGPGRIVGDCFFCGTREGEDGELEFAGVTEEQEAWIREHFMPL